MHKFYEQQSRLKLINDVKSRASLAYENIVRFSRDFYKMILVGKFPSLEIGEKCAGCHL